MLSDAGGEGESGIGLDLRGGGDWRTDAMTDDEEEGGEELDARADGVSWAGPGSGGESGGSGGCPNSAKKRFDVVIIFLAGPISFPAS